MTKSKITACVFLALVGGLAVLNLFAPSRTFSENENRYLAQWPAFSAEALLDGSYTAGIEAYVTDQFVFRDGWVGVKTLTEQALQKHVSNGVYFAKDQYLIEQFDAVDRERYEKNLAFVAQFAQRAEQELGAEVHTMLVPTASMILADRLPANAPELDQQALLAQAAAALPGFVDVSGALAAHSAEALYYRTDHHWTSLGAYYVYAHWREQQGFQPPALADYTQQTLSTTFFGTNWSKASLYTVPPDTITALLLEPLPPYTVWYEGDDVPRDSIYELAHLAGKDKYSVFLNANQPLTRIETGSPSGGKLLLIKDSYANTFVQPLLGDYSEIYVVDLRYFKLSVHDFIKEHGIDQVLVLYNIKNFAGDSNLFYLTT